MTKSEQKKRIRLTISLDRDIYKKIEEQKVNRGVSLSQVVNELCVNHISRYQALTRPIPKVNVQIYYELERIHKLLETRVESSKESRLDSEEHHAFVRDVYALLLDIRFELLGIDRVSETLIDFNRK